MSKRSVLFASLLWLSATGLSFGQVTADDFLPPVQGGPVDVKAPDKVRFEKGVVVAATAQDAINAAVQQNKKDAHGEKTTEVGARMVKFPSGLGFVATAAASYRVMENPTATQIAKRKAYVVAFTQSKKHLASILGGLSNESKEFVRQSLRNVTLPKEDMNNISTQGDESVAQAVDMLLRGFVIYEVQDDVKQNMVTVSIVTTPKTRGRMARPAPNVVEVDDLREGLNQVIQEVRTGVVPPVGCRVVLLRATGETALVGFGSAVVRTSENDAVQAKLNLSAQKIADMRSKDALCGLIAGDHASWRGRVVESLKDEVKGFEELAADDPLAKDNPAGVRKLDKAQQTFVSKLRTDDVYTSARKGILPPGVITKTWFDADHAWAYGMSVYAPSATKAATEAAREMAHDLLLRSGKGVPAQGPDSSGFKDEKNPNVKRPGGTVKPGPSGKVGKDEDK